MSFSFFLHDLLDDPWNNQFQSFIGHLFIQVDSLSLFLKNLLTVTFVGNNWVNVMNGPQSRAVWISCAHFTVQVHIIQQRFEVIHQQDDDVCIVSNYGDLCCLCQLKCCANNDCVSIIHCLLHSMPFVFKCCCQKSDKIYLCCNHCIGRHLDFCKLVSHRKTGHWEKIAQPFTHVHCCCCCCFLLLVQLELDMVAKHRAEWSSVSFASSMILMIYWTVVPVHFQLLVHVTYGQFDSMASTMNQYRHNQSWNPKAGCKCRHRIQMVFVSQKWYSTWIHVGYYQYIVSPLTS